jgi:hypothetical protein
MQLSNEARRMAAAHLPPWSRRALVDAARCGPPLLAELRLWSGTAGGLPDFLIIGAQRCGTTYLHSLLVAHPDVARPLTKEVEFFDRHWHRGVAWYRTHFRGLPRRTTGGEGSVTGEASPSYLFHPLAAERARAVVAEARIIVLLRNPADRAYSHYLHAVRLGYEAMSFENALMHEQQGPSVAAQRLRDDQFSASGHYSYIARGMYVEQLDDWMRMFPGTRLLTIRSEDFYADVRGTLRRVSDFLGIRPWHPARLPDPKSFPYPAMNPRTRQCLLDYFRPFNERLHARIGRDMQWDA